MSKVQITLLYLMADDWPSFVIAVCFSVVGMFIGIPVEFIGRKVPQPPAHGCRKGLGPSPTTCLASFPSLTECA